MTDELKAYEDMLRYKAEKYDRLKDGIENLIKQYQHRLEGSI